MFGPFTSGSYNKMKTVQVVGKELTSAKISLDEVAGTFGSGLNGTKN